MSKIEEVYKQIEKKFGKGIIRNNSEIIKVDVISTGIMNLDKALGVKGLVRGRIIELYGTQAGGKSTLALSVIKQAQLKGLKTVYIDAEAAFNYEFAKKMGIDIDKIIIAQPDYGEQALEIADMYVKSEEISLIVIDSVAALVPKAELEGEMGDSVTFDTPVYIRNKKDKYIDIIPISDLFLGSKYFLKNRYAAWYRKHKRIEILTHRGWSDIKGVVKKENIYKKPIIATRTTEGYVKTTEDHCLFQNNKEKSIKELKVFDRIDFFNKFNLIINDKKFLNSEIAWLLGFWVAEGSFLPSRGKNNFEICNTDINLIKKSDEILNKYFMVKTRLRSRTNTNIRKKLYILSAYSCKEIGFLLQRCCCNKSKLKKIPKYILNANQEIKKAFLEGFYEGDGSHNSKNKCEQYYNNSLPVIAGLQYLLKSLDKKTGISVHPDRPEGVILRKVKKHTKKRNEIIQFYNCKKTKELYDISTKEGTFVTAIGNIIIHNSQIGLQARLISKSLRKLTMGMKKTNTCIIFINQLRENINTMGYCPKTTTPGGRALKFYSSIRIDIRPIGQIKKGEEVIGSKVKAKVTKNKLAPPFKTALFRIYFDSGLSEYADVMINAIDQKLIKKSGKWYSYNDYKWNGEEQVREELKTNKKLLKELKKELGW